MDCVEKTHPKKMPRRAVPSPSVPPQLPWLLLRAGYVWWRETASGSCGRKTKHRGAKSARTGRAPPAAPRRRRPRPGRIRWQTAPVLAGEALQPGFPGLCSSEPALVAAPL